MRQKRATFSHGGVHPPEMKLTSSAAITDIELPSKVIIGLSQSIGKPAVECVSVNDHVDRGQLIGKAQGAVSANVHTPISGTVRSIGEVRDMTGHWQRAVTIEASAEDHMTDLQSIADQRPVRTIDNAIAMDRHEIISLIEQAGIVGLGGATFPAAVKLNVPDGTDPTVVINGSECEPYLTCDERIMIEMPDEIIAGIKILIKAAGAPKAIVGIEDNKSEAIARMTAAAFAMRKSGGEVRIVTLKTRYPQGGEKMLVEALTGKKIAPGALPISQGAVVQNVATALAVYHAVIWGLPLIERVMTVSGGCVARPGNYRVPIGTETSRLIDRLTQSTTDDAPDRIIAGGTMMGRALAGIEGFTTKGTGGLLMLRKNEVKRFDPQPCVRCGRCVDSCPMGLQPYLLARLSEIGRPMDAVAEGLMNCMECGCCSYSCIASRRLVDWIRVGKMLAREKK